MSIYKIELMYQTHFFLSLLELLLVYEVDNLVNLVDNLVPSFIRNYLSKNLPMFYDGEVSLNGDGDSGPD